MPIVSGNYESPTWVNDQAPKLNASEMNAITETVEASQVLTGSGAPTSATAGVVGQKYVDTSTTPPTLYLCTATSGGYTWWDFVAELNNKANIDGYYEDMTVGNAEQLISTVRVTDTAPYLFRTTGGSADVGNRSYPVLTGGTIAWNQILEPTATGWTLAAVSLSVSNGVFSVSPTTSSTSYKSARKNMLVPGHRYYIACDGYTDSSNGNTAYFRAYTNSFSTSIANMQGVLSIPAGETYSHRQNIFTPNVGYTYLYLAFMTGEASSTTAYVTNCVLVDLTLMFGTAIADYVASLETAEAGSGIAWLKSYGFFRRSYYAYDAGTLMSVCTSQHKTVGLNAYNPTTGTAQLVGGQQYQITGTYTAVAYADINGNAETLTPDADGYFTPTNSGTLTVTGGNATDTCVHLVWSGGMDDTWEPYTEHTYPLDSVVLRGLPQLSSDNQLYYGGDYYSPSGEITRRYAEIDLTNHIWTYTPAGSGVNKSYFRCTVAGRPSGAAKTNGAITIICSKYPSTLNRAYSAMGTYTGNYDRICLDSSNGNVVVYTDDYTDVDAFKAAMSGVKLVYLLTASGQTTESADPYTSPQVVDDFGTEEYTDALYAAGTRDVEIPVGHTTEYPANLRDKLQHLPDLADADGRYSIQQAGTQMSLTPDTAPGRLNALEAKVPNPPSTDGTYTLQVVVATVDEEQTATYSWVAAT